MGWDDTALRMFVACALGALVGFERQLHQRTAGLRTNMLVSLGSAAFTVFGATYLANEAPRVVAQIISGIGFLGAGAIMREGLTVHGLNTAATLWCSAGIGIFSGGGYYLSALILSFFIVFTNTLLRNFENYIDRHPVILSETEVNYVIEIVCSQTHNRDVRETLLKRMRYRHFLLKHMQVKAREDGHVMLEALFRTKGLRDQSVEQVVEDLSLDPDIVAIEWRIAHPQEEG